jgi:hypothetical protein
LARVVVLTEARILRTGNGLKTLRNEINSSKRLGYVTKIYEGFDAVSILDSLFLKHKKRNFRTESGFTGEFEGIDLVVCAGSDEMNQVIAISAVWVSATYAVIFYYFSIEKCNIRWIVNKN